MIRGQDTEEVLYVWWGCVEQGDGDGCWHRPEPPSHSVINTTAALSTLHQLQPLPTNNLQTSHITHLHLTPDGLQSTLLTMLFKKFHVSLTRFYVTHYRYREIRPWFDFCEKPKCHHHHFTSILRFSTKANFSAEAIAGLWVKLGWPGEQHPAGEPHWPSSSRPAQTLNW